MNTSTRILAALTLGSVLALAATACGASSPHSSEPTDIIISTPAASIPATPTAGGVSIDALRAAIEQGYLAAAMDVTPLDITPASRVDCYLRAIENADWDQEALAAILDGNGDYFENMRGAEHDKRVAFDDAMNTCENVGKVH